VTAPPADFVRRADLEAILGFMAVSHEIDIAEAWLSPGTVKKHLENVYGKLGVGNRAAAASMVRSQRTAG
jgi:Bacterial regulatory proteins, luxR family